MAVNVVFEVKTLQSWVVCGGRFWGGHVWQLSMRKRRSWISKPLVTVVGGAIMDMSRADGGGAIEDRDFLEQVNWLSWFFLFSETLFLTFWWDSNPPPLALQRKGEGRKVVFLRQAPWMVATTPTQLMPELVAVVIFELTNSRLNWRNL